MNAQQEFAQLVHQTSRAIVQQMENGIDAIYLPKGLESVLEMPQRSTAPLQQDRPATLKALYEAQCTCTKCSLGHRRQHFVFGSGNKNADVMFIGEAPGAEEDAKGLPFVGSAGQLLTKILNAIGFTRDEVYIANILKCRPPDNRDPMPEEIAACEPILREQIQLIQPRLICALGRVAAQALLKTTDSLGRLRGRFHDYHGVKLLVTYHPSALLRNTSYKRPTWDDVQRLRQEYDRLAGR